MHIKADFITITSRKVLKGCRSALEVSSFSSFGKTFHTNQHRVLNNIRSKAPTKLLTQDVAHDFAD
jgi:hypothetical protein